MIALWLLIAVLVTWRITSLLARERGPLAIFTRLRSVFGVYHEPDGSPAFDEDSGEVLLNPIFDNRLDDALHEIARGMTCIWCLSVFVAAGITAKLADLLPEVVYDGWSWLLVALALSAATIFAEALSERLSG